MNLVPMWLSFGLLAGVHGPDPRLADYQWNVAPHAAWGAQALAGTGPFAAGVRVWATATTQRLDPGASAAVHSTSVELVGQGRLAGLGFADAVAVGSAGRVHLAYRPEQVTVSGTTVDLRPIDAWAAGGGLALRRALPRGFQVALSAEYRRYALDTAHQSGGAVVERRESFGDWSARFELARVHFVR